VYQCVLGNQRTVIVNDWATMFELWVGQSHALIDRPHQPGFVDRLGIDLTGFPMTEQVRKCRAAGMRALAKVSLIIPHSLQD
jgi:phenylacetate 2-hydroxylase